jgi:hypothetical protein
MNSALAMTMISTFLSLSRKFERLNLRSYACLALHLLPVAQGVMKSLDSIDRLRALEMAVNFASSNPLTLNDLYRAANTCRSTDDFIGSYSGRYFVSNERALRQVMYLLDTAGVNLSFRYDEELQTEIPVIFGLPWLISDAVVTNSGSPDTTNIYVLPLEGETALRLLYAKDVNHECDEWGIHCYDLPLQQSTSQLSKAVVGFYSVYAPEATLVRINTVPLSDAMPLP